MAIEVTLHADEASRSPDRGCRWTARATLPDGRQFEARSRSGAVYELARVLVAAGIGDDGLVVRQASPPLPGPLGYQSFYTLAKFTIVEGAASPLRRLKYRDPTLDFKIDAAVECNGINRGEGGGAGRVVAGEASTPAFAGFTHLLADAAE